MIELRDVTRAYPTNDGLRTVLDRINLTLHKGERIGIVGRNGAGKSTLVRLVSGAERPTTGTIRREMSVSWPLAFSGGFQPGLTGADNLRFICRIYGVDFRPNLNFVQEFSELGRYLFEPIAVYSSGMRARLAFAISMVVDFDCYLIDEVVAVGDEGFREKCEVELFQKRADRAMIIISHSFRYLSEHCTRFALLHEGTLQEFGSSEEVRLAYKAVMQPKPKPEPALEDQL